jgi:hypothetical protein
MSKGWARLRTLSPQQVQSKDPLPLSVTCRQNSARGEPAGNAGSRDTRSQTAGSGNPSQKGPPPDVTQTKSPSGSGTDATVHGGVQSESAGSSQVDPETDSVQIIGILPRPGTVLPRGQPFQFELAIRYNLVSADAAFLAISVVQIRQNDSGCAGVDGELVDAVQVPAVRGVHTLKQGVTWSGDTGLATKGRKFGRGLVSFAPSLWENINGNRGERLKYFGTYTQFCYPFGPAQ